MLHNNCQVTADENKSIKRFSQQLIFSFLKMLKLLIRNSVNRKSNFCLVFPYLFTKIQNKPIIFSLRNSLYL